MNETLQINVNLITVNPAGDRNGDSAETSDGEDVESGKDTTEDKVNSTREKRSVVEGASSDKEDEEVQSLRAKRGTH